MHPFFSEIKRKRTSSREGQGEGDNRPRNLGTGLRFLRGGDSLRKSLPRMGKDCPRKFQRIGKKCMPRG